MYTELAAAQACPVLTVAEDPRASGALVYSGDEPPKAGHFQEWVAMALWMLENSGVAVRNLPNGKYVALAYKGGYVVISSDMVEELSEEMRQACTVCTFEELGVPSRERTCIIFTATPFVLSVLHANNGKHMAFLCPNTQADAVVFSPTRLANLG
ncbi:MAG: hypothetical protein JSS66_06580 [Armatimonadetes bacterium]|nr:hypothetical protein [Armatimonadota bacterium]